MNALASAPPALLFLINHWESLLIFSVVHAYINGHKVLSVAINVTYHTYVNQTFSSVEHLFCLFFLSQCMDTIALPHHNTGYSWSSDTDRCLNK